MSAELKAVEGSPDWYRQAWHDCEIRPGSESKVRAAVTLVERGFWRYEEVANWLKAKNIQNVALILGVIHYKEAACDFQRVLHNGEKIVGTNRKTTLVPKDRGPFLTWAGAAYDAITFQPAKWKKVLSGSKDLSTILEALEKYNGTGYINGAGKADTSPYLWACSTINDGTGLYVADGKYDAEKSTLSTVGAAVILKEFYKLKKFDIEY